MKTLYIAIKYSRNKNVLRSNTRFGQSRRPFSNENATSENLEEREEKSRQISYAGDIQQLCSKAGEDLLRVLAENETANMYVVTVTRRYQS